MVRKEFFWGKKWKWMTKTSLVELENFLTFDEVQQENSNQKLRTK